MSDLRREAERFFARADIWANLITRSEIAKAARVSLPAVTNWENRFRDFPEPFIPVRKGGNYMALYWKPDIEDFMARHQLGLYGKKK